MIRPASLQKWIATAAVVICLTGCFRSGGHLPSNNSRIVNGERLFVAYIPVSCLSRISLPQDAMVAKVENLEEIQIVFKKKLCVFGHPPKQIEFNDVERRMGITTAIQDLELILNTFGEYAFPGHGGASIDVYVIVPEGLEVVNQQAVDGATSSTRSSVLQAEVVSDSEAERLMRPFRSLKPVIE